MNKEKLNLSKYTKKELAMSLEKVSKKGIIFVFFADLVAFILYFFIRGGYNFLKTPWSDYFTVMGIFIGGFILHELLHAIVWRVACEDGFKNVNFGFDPVNLKPYCKPTEVITINQYRLGKVLPLIITGIAPYLVSLIISSFLLMLGSLLLIGLCGIDIVILLSIAKVKNKALVIDDEYDYGCIVLEEKE